LINVKSIHSWLPALKNRSGQAAASGESNQENIKVYARSMVRGDLLSPETVKGHLKSIYRKLNVHTRGGILQLCQDASEKSQSRKHRSKTAVMGKSVDGSTSHARDLPFYRVPCCRLKLNA